MNKKTRGIIFTLAGGTMWGLSGVCGQYLFTNYDVNSSWLTAIRMLGAGVVLGILCLLKQRENYIGIWKEKKDSMQLIIFALFGLLFCQYAYLTAISKSNAATATVLQYLGPVLIMVLVCFRNKKLPNKPELAAIILAVLGTFLLATHGNPSTMVLSKGGLGWGLISAVSLVCYTLLPVGIIPKWGSMVVTGYGMLIGGVVLAIAINFFQIPVNLDVKGWLAVCGVVFVGTAFAYTIYLQGVSDIGPVKGSLLSSVEPVSSTIISVLWLHTRFEVIDLIGFASIMATVFLLTKKEEAN